MEQVEYVCSKSKRSVARPLGISPGDYGLGSTARIPDTRYKPVQTLG